MANVRLISRLDIKGENLIKGIQMEGLRVVGDPQEFAQRYYRQGIDELIYMDTVASLYNRNNLAEIVRYTAENIFIPLTVGGGIRSVEDAKSLLRAGADKVAINTAATIRPKLITEISRSFGTQCMVLSIEAKQLSDNKWEVLTDNGREHTGLDVIEWAIQGQELGAGEILLTSVDKEGTCRGFDLNLVKAVCSAVSIPVIASGGMGSTQHLVEVIQVGGADAVAMANVLHYNKLGIEQLRESAIQNNIHVRQFV